MNEGGKTKCDIAYWIPKWIKCRGVKKLQEMGRMSGDMLALANGQDLIGYRHFMEGRISTKFWTIQSRHLALSDGHLSGTEWTKGFISRILKITQSQWFTGMSLSMTSSMDMPKERGWRSLTTKFVR